MTSTASSSKLSLPQPGKFNVNIGPSLGRALRARKGAESAPQRGPGKHPRDLHAIRYGWLPESIDFTKAATMEVKPTKDATLITVDRPCIAKGNVESSQLFAGTEKPAMDYECVLLFDPSTQQWILEKLDSTMVLTSDRKVTHSRKADPREPATQRSTPTPAQAAAPSAVRTSTSQASNTHKRKRSEIDAMLERELGLDDADGEIDEDYAAPVPPPTSKAAAPRRSPAPDRPSGSTKVKTTKVSPAKKIKREPVKREPESEGEIVEDDPLPPPRPTPAQVKTRLPSPPIRAPPTRPPVSRQPAPMPQPPASKPQPNLSLPPKPVSSILPAKSKERSSAPIITPAPVPTSAAIPNPKKRNLPANVQEETIKFGWSAQAAPPKRARPSPPPEKVKVKDEGFSLALPGGDQPSPALPPPPPPKSAPAPIVSLPGSSNSAVALPPSAAPAAADDDDSEPEWDEVQLTAPAPAPAPAPAAISISLSGPPRAIVMEEIDPAGSASRTDSDDDADAYAEEEEEEIDISAFAAQMNEQLDEGEDDADGDADGDMDDFLALEMEEPQPDVPLWGDDDDEYSSSEESDDD
ncbi:hypothetical protein CERSUDRAFT_121601 [Gelatoporia subvermispora B]|uniref:Transcription elongation factor Eaf N-terminal domain-containing protein n=1 Tax=Ceriporiopsis subvermispora (strain B) TaxID=914234 RepID=M2PW37_CERS8|nr:hypothetical protein CERSUDRAFT_121601 [Gelatoporia subvermispora B]